MRLVQAEILKLRKRRGLMAWSALLTVGSVAVAFGVMEILHLASPGKHGPAGGAGNLESLMWLLGSLGGIAAILIGTTAGSQDSSAGVLRDLVVTGRSRSSLFRVRMPGALVVFLPLLATAFAAAVAGTFLLAGSSPSPTWHAVAGYAEALAASGIVTLAVAVALGSLIPARIATGVLIGWNAIVTPLLLGFSVLGTARAGLNNAAAYHFAPANVHKATTIPMATATALLVLLAWVAVSQRLGAWWTKRIDV